ncbi:Wzz/FepE/Etk N-terminal domain-containing protein [Planktomarina temperata]|nr:Wzz/FepE/Etk N-terminal domain-containing protein [Planktomarina temperata]
MTDLRPDLADDEIDLRELFAVLWHGKWLIFSLCCVALLLASVYLHSAERKYTVSMILKPEISPLSLLLIFLWPITDMLLSMLRRKRSGKPIGQPDRLHFHQTVMRLLEIQFFTRSRRNLTNPLGTLIILPMAIAPMVLAVVFKTQTGAAFIAFWGFVAVFAVAYRWALRRGGQASNRTSRKFEQS